jgi:hypothetical protein
MKNKAIKFASYMLIVLMLSVIAAGGWTLAASAYAPNPYTELLWWRDNGLKDGENPFKAVIGGTSYDLGYNTIEVIDLTGVSGDPARSYDLVLHPQYFPYFDDQYTATHALTITSLKVLIPNTSTYVECWDRGFVKIPESYTLTNTRNKRYLQCQVSIDILDIRAGVISDDFWNPAFMQIPDDVSSDAALR